MTTRSSYLLLLSENAVFPHCEARFFHLFGSLHWSWTWRQLFFFDLDRPVIDLAWKVSHGSFTRPRGLPLLVMIFPTLVLVQTLWSLCSICSSIVFWLLVFFLGFSPLCFWLLLCVLRCCFVMHYLVSPRMSCEWFLRFFFVMSLLTPSRPNECSGHL